MTCPFWADLLANYSLALRGRYLHGGGLFFCNDARARYGINTHIIVLESSISSLVLLPSRIYSSTRRSLVLKRLTFLPLDAGTCTASYPPLYEPRLWGSTDRIFGALDLLKCKGRGRFVLACSFSG